MKTSLITFFALAGIAMGDVITLNPTPTVTGVTGGAINANRPFEGATNYTPEDLQSIIDVIQDPTISGWYTGVGQGSNYVSDVSLTETGFNFICRSGVSYEYVLGFVSAPKDTTSLTMSFTADKNVSASIWSFNKETESITLLMGQTTATANTPFSQTIDNLQLGENDMIVFAWSGSATGGASGATPIAITNVSLTATTESIPEPTTATLSLLALAGLAARRRRR